MNELLLTNLSRSLGDESWIDETASNLIVSISCKARQ